MKGASFGIEWDFLYNISEPFVLISSFEVVELVSKMSSILSSSGATVKNFTFFTELVEILSNVGANAPICSSWLFKEGVDIYLSELGPKAPFKSLKEILESGQLIESAKSYVSQAVNSAGSFDSSFCSSYKEGKEYLADKIEELMDEIGVDVLLFPNSNQQAPFLNNLNPKGFTLTVIVSAFSGLPSLNVPIGFTPSNNSPLGITILGKRFQEAQMISYAFALEQIMNPRKPPPFTPSLV